MKRTEKARYLIMGMLIMLILSTIIMPALAASNMRQITAYFNGIKIYVDDNLIQPKDSNGKTVEPFLYNGTTYLPVRAVADALGQPVIWDGKTSSVYLGKHDSSTPAANLLDMEPFYTEEEEYVVSLGWEEIGKSGVKDNIGNTYYKGIHMCDDYMNVSYGGYQVYLINQKYTHFKGTIALSEKWKSSTGSAMIKIYGDDKLLYMSPEMTKGVYPEDFDIDVSGVVQIKIEWGDDSPSTGIIFAGLDFYS